MSERESRIEARWPVALAVSTFIAITIVLRVAQPHRETIGPTWFVPGLEIAMLLALLAADPTRIAARRAWLRPIAIALVCALLFVSVLSTTKLVIDLIRGGSVTQDASSLLASGALIWIGNVVAFSLFYWLLDSGGPVARMRGEHAFIDFAFTQHMSPELAPPDWKAQYVDYFVLALTTNTAFSPTDVMPMRHWTKLTMSLQSLLALVVIGLVIARAVNVFT